MVGEIVSQEGETRPTKILSAQAISYSKVFFTLHLTNGRVGTFQRWLKIPKVVDSNTEPLLGKPEVALGVSLLILTMRAKTGGCHFRFSLVSSTFD